MTDKELISKLAPGFFVLECIVSAVIAFAILSIADLVSPKRPIKRFLYKISNTPWDEFENGGRNLVLIIKMVIAFAVFKISFLLGVALVVLLLILRKRSGSKTITEAEKLNTPADSFQISYTMAERKGVLGINNPYRGNLIIGGAGSGKSKSLIYPIIQQSAEKGFTGILYDFKFPELTGVLQQAYQNTGINVFTINFNEPQFSHRINPLNPEGMLNSSYARELALTLMANLNSESIKKRDFWIQSAETILTSVIWFLRCEYPQYCTLPHAISLILYSKPQELIKRLQENEEVAGLISSVADGLVSDNQTAGVMATVKSSLAMLNRPELFWVLSGSDFDLTLNNPDKKTFLCIANDPALTESISPLVSLLIISALKRMNTPNKAPSVVILDEAPTLYIPNFEQIPATGRSNKIATVFCAQDIAQIEDKYGVTKSETILSNLGNQFYGRTTNPKTAERIIKLFGKHEVEFSSFSKSRKTDDLFTKTRSESKSFQQRERVEIQQILNLQSGSFFSIVSEGSGDLNARPIQIIETQCATEMLLPFDIDKKDIDDNYYKIQGEAKVLVAETPKQPLLDSNPFLS